MIRKKIILIIIIVFSGCLFFAQTIKISAEELKFSDDIFLYGITSSQSFYFPVGAAQNISSAKFRLYFRFTELAGPRTMITATINEKPLTSQRFEESEGFLDINIPVEYLTKELFSNLKLTASLDYGVCDNFNLKKESLWFQIKNISYLEFNYEKKPIELIPDFFKPYTLSKELNLVLNDISEIDFNFLINIAKIAGYESKGYKKELTVSENLKDSVDNVLLVKGTDIFLDKGNLYIGKDAEDLINGNYLSFSPSSSVSVLEARRNESNQTEIAFSKMSFDDSPVEIVYGGQKNFGFSADWFNGIPQDVKLTLFFSSYETSGEEEILISVFLNGFLEKKIKVDSSKSIQSEEISLPKEHFSAYNSLTFDMTQFNAQCKASNIKIYSDSGFSFTKSEPLLNNRVSFFPDSLYGRTLYIVSDFDLQAAKVIAEISFIKGESSERFLQDQIISLDQFTKGRGIVKDFDSILLLLNPEDLGKMNFPVQLYPSFKIVNQITKNILFDTKMNGFFPVLYSFNLEEKPAVLLSFYGEETRTNEKTALDMKLMKRISGNLGILKDSRVFSYEIGDSLNVVGSNLVSEKSFWEKYRFWIVLFIVLALVIIVVVSFFKTSRSKTIK